jgi:DNA-binding MarR family transcriptional regulator
MASMDPSRDLAWLLQRCGQRLRAATDATALKNGLTGGLRDYMVLLLLATERPRTQNELGRLAGVDKTTLMGVLDRMEKDGLVERRLDPENRRTRTPVLTAKGRKLYTVITKDRLDVEIPGMSEGELRSLISLLTKLDAACEEAGMTISGSCV